MFFQEFKTRPVLVSILEIAVSSSNSNTSSFRCNFIPVCSWNPDKTLHDLCLAHMEADGSLAPLNLLPGPWHGAKDREDYRHHKSVSSVSKICNSEAFDFEHFWFKSQITLARRRKSACFSWTLSHKKKASTYSGLSAQSTKRLSDGYVHLEDAGRCAARQVLGEVVWWWQIELVFWASTSPGPPSECLYAIVVKTRIVYPYGPYGDGHRDL